MDGTLKFSMQRVPEEGQVQVMPGFLYRYQQSRVGVASEPKQERLHLVVLDGQIGLGYLDLPSGRQPNDVADRSVRAVGNGSELVKREGQRKAWSIQALPRHALGQRDQLPEGSLRLLGQQSAFAKAVIDLLVVDVAEVGEQPGPERLEQQRI